MILLSVRSILFMAHLLYGCAPDLQSRQKRNSQCWQRPVLASQSMSARLLQPGKGHQPMSPIAEIAFYKLNFSYLSRISLLRPRLLMSISLSCFLQFQSGHDIYPTFPLFMFVMTISYMHCRQNICSHPDKKKNLEPKSQRKQILH